MIRSVTSGHQRTEAGHNRCTAGGLRSSQRCGDGAEKYQCEVHGMEYYLIYPAAKSAMIETFMMEVYVVKSECVKAS